MSILYYLSLTGYAASLSILMMFLGVNWNRIRNTFKLKPKMMVIIIYTLNFFVMLLGFKISFLPHFLFNTFLIGAIYLGTHF